MAGELVPPQVRPEPTPSPRHKTRLTSTPSPRLNFDAGPPPDHDLVEVAARAADVGVLDLHGELDLAREASRRRRRERRLVHVEPRRDEVEAERRGPARGLSVAWRVHRYCRDAPVSLSLSAAWRVDGVPRRHRRDDKLSTGTPL